MAKVTTGTGDTGYTGLIGEQRVPNMIRARIPLEPYQSYNCL